MSKKDNRTLAERLGFNEPERLHETTLRSEDPESYHTRLYAVMDEAAAKLVILLSRTECPKNLSEGLNIDIGTATLELGMNAAKDGNLYKPGSTVQFGFYLRDNILSIAVKDEGIGFNPYTTIEKICAEELPVDEHEESVSAVLKRIDTSQFELPLDDPARPNGCGMGLKRVIRGLRTFQSLHAQKYDDGLCVRVDLDLSKRYRAAR